MGGRAERCRLFLLSLTLEALQEKRGYLPVSVSFVCTSFPHSLGTGFPCTTPADDWWPSFVLYDKISINDFLLLSCLTFQFSCYLCNQFSPIKLLPLILCFPGWILTIVTEQANLVPLAQCAAKPVCWPWIAVEERIVFIVGWQAPCSHDPNSLMAFRDRFLKLWGRGSQGAWSVHTQVLLISWWWGNWVIWESQLPT